MTPRISAKIYGLVRRDAHILVERIHHADGTLKCFRPLGGTLEFGETSEAGLRREMREELGTEIAIVSLFCVAEEIYEYRGRPGHQVAFIYEIELLDPALYEQETIERIDTEHGIKIKAEWLDPSQMPAGVVLVPEDLATKLAVQA